MVRALRLPTMSLSTVLSLPREARGELVWVEARVADVRAVTLSFVCEWCGQRLVPGEVRCAMRCAGAASRCTVMTEMHAEMDDGTARMVLLVREPALVWQLLGLKERSWARAAVMSMVRWVLGGRATVRSGPSDELCEVRDISGRMRSERPPVLRDLLQRVRAAASRGAARLLCRRLRCDPAELRTALLLRGHYVVTARPRHALELLRIESTAPRHDTREAIARLQQQQQQQRRQIADEEM